VHDQVGVREAAAAQAAARAVAHGGRATFRALDNLMGRDIEATVIARLRAQLAVQVSAPLAVSAKGQQYYFDEEHAAYNDIDIKHGDAFAVVVCQGQLPYEEMIVRLWHHYADEVWLVDRSDEMITIIPREGLIRVFAVGETLRSARVPGLAISVAALFEISN
jgi:hypothetical protein